jgi:hypothetical protein
VVLPNVQFFRHMSRILDGPWHQGFGRRAAAGIVPASAIRRSSRFQPVVVVFRVNFHLPGLMCR